MSLITKGFCIHGTMSPTSVIIQCVACSQTIPCNAAQCPHCLVKYCSECLIRHQNYDVKNEFIDMIKRIDEILTRFLHHAHNQTDWTDHLTSDRKRLEIYIELIENHRKNSPMAFLPNHQWVDHVNCLIRKTRFSITENCCPLMYPFVNSSIQL